MKFSVVQVQEIKYIVIKRQATGLYVSNTYGDAKRLLVLLLCD